MAQTTKAQREVLTPTQLSNMKRRRAGGKTGRMVKVRGGFIVVMRSHSHGGHSQARAGWTCDDTKSKSFGTAGEPSRSAGLGPFRVSMPNNRVHYVRPNKEV